MVATLWYNIALFFRNKFNTKSFDISKVFY